MQIGAKTNKSVAQVWSLGKVSKREVSGDYEALASNYHSQPNFPESEKLSFWSKWDRKSMMSFKETLFSLEIILGAGVPIDTHWQIKKEFLNKT